jgi:single-stranded DNA-binding protein
MDAGGGSFTVAVNPREYEQQARRHRDAGPSFAPVQAWRRLAENRAETLTEGIC